MRNIEFDGDVFMVTRTDAGLIEVHLTGGSITVDGDEYRVLNNDRDVLEDTVDAMTIHQVLRWGMMVLSEQ